MIAHIPIHKVSNEQIQKLSLRHQAVYHTHKENYVLVFSAQLKELPVAFKEYATEVFPMETDIQLSNASYSPAKREIQLGDIVLGGDSNHTAMMMGPCSVESEQQLETIAQCMLQHNLKILRAGSYKPRTSPYSFQGMGLEGLRLLDKIRQKYGFHIITEARDATQIEDVIAYSDIIQVGSKAMYDQGILRACGKANKPVLIKRGFGATLQEFIQASEFILSAGNYQVMLCERGIRTFETKTRFTLDLCGVAYLQQYTNLPVVIDPSHPIGYAYGVPSLSRASVAMGVEGLLIEVHPDPSQALSDAKQQIDIPAFETLYQSLLPVAQAVGREIV